MGARARNVLILLAALAANGCSLAMRADGGRGADSYWVPAGDAVLAAGMLVVGLAHAGNQPSEGTSGDDMHFEQFKLIVGGGAVTAAASAVIGMQDVDAARQLEAQRQRAADGFHGRHAGADAEYPVAADTARAK